MVYAEVSVIVDGALDSDRTFTNQDELDAYLEMVRVESETDGQPTEVYVLYHEHGKGADCLCIQYETDHHPYARYNMAD